MATNLAPARDRVIQKLRELLALGPENLPQVAPEAVDTFLQGLPGVLCRSLGQGVATKWFLELAGWPEETIVAWVGPGPETAPETRKLKYNDEYRYENGDEKHDGKAIVMLKEPVFGDAGQLVVTVNAERFRHITRWQDWHIFGGEKTMSGYLDAKINVLTKEGVLYTTDIPSDNGYPTPSDGYIWKPVTEGGDCVNCPGFLFKPGDREEREVAIVLPDGTKRQFFCGPNSTKAHQRCVYLLRDRCENLPKNLTLIVGDRRFSIPDPCVRYD